MNEFATKASIGNQGILRSQDVLLWSALAFCFLIYALKLIAISSGRLEIGLEGDEGVRIFHAVRFSESWYSIFRYVVDSWLGIHPPGDIAVRATAFKIFRALGSEANPVQVALYLSATLGFIGAIFFTLSAHRIGGSIAATATAVLLAVSWKFHNPTLSGMGEGTLIPFFAVQLYLLVIGIQYRAPSYIFYSAFAGLLASTVRPEPIFFLPGLCLALWFANGFLQAFAYGAIASFYLLAKTIYSILFVPDSITILNFSNRYTFTGIPLEKFFLMPFGRDLLNDPFPYSLVAILALAIFSIAVKWGEILKRTSRVDLANFALFSGAIAYLLVVGYSVVTGKTANASVRLGYFPSYALFINASYGLSLLLSWICERINISALAGPKLRWLPSTTKLQVVVVVIGLFAAAYWANAMINSIGVNRAPRDSIAIKNWLLTNAGYNDGIAFDRNWNRENWLVGYVAGRKNICAYFYCKSEFSIVTSNNNNLGENCRAHGLACLYKQIHRFIEDEKPLWLVTHSGKFSTRWLDVQNRIFKEDGFRLWSFFHPYTAEYKAGQRDFSKPLTRVQLISGKDITLTQAFKSGDFYVYKITY